MEQFVRQGISSYLDIIPVLCQNTMLFKRENTVLPPTASRRAVGIRFSSGRAPVRPYTQKEVGRYGFLSTCHPRVPGTTGIHCPRPGHCRPVRSIPTTVGMKCPSTGSIPRGCRGNSLHGRGCGGGETLLCTQHPRHHPGRWHRAGGRLRPCFWRRGPQHRPHEPDSGI